MYKEACCVVSNLCTHPWNIEPLQTAPCKCYVCGGRVCKKCSLVLLDTYTNRHVRACLGCIESEPERFNFEEGDYESIRRFWLKKVEGSHED